MSDEDAIIAANAAFYAAFAGGDIAAMTGVWAEADDISCIHPGWPALLGPTAVLGSWRDILQTTTRPQIVCAEPQAVIDGDQGRVLCIEVVDGSPLATSNHFKRVAGTWRMVHHQSTPIAEFLTDTDADGHSLH
jgi:ketosteroid isomerase-like protein